MVGLGVGNCAGVGLGDDLDTLVGVRVGNCAEVGHGFGLEVRQDIVVGNVERNDMIKDRIVLEVEERKENIKLRKKKTEISKEVKKKKFQFETRVKLTKADQKEIKRTHMGACSTGSGSQRLLS